VIGGNSTTPDRFKDKWTQVRSGKLDLTRSLNPLDLQIHRDLQETSVSISLLVYNHTQSLEQFCHDLLFKTPRCTLGFFRIMIIQSIKKVQIGMQIHIFRTMERCLAKDLESQSDTSSQCNLTSALHLRVTRRLRSRN
jgi:hypothetical protein